MPASEPSTPLMQQYEGVKARYPGHLVLFRVGDFYETFGEDAKLLSNELEVVLTARAADGRGERIPMAGVPHHAVESYLARLVRKGYKVALCDQVEDARLAKGLVRREVTRVVTPGTVVEDRILGGPTHNFLASLLLRSDARGAYAVVDITTGEWFHGGIPTSSVESAVSAMAPFYPREILLAIAGSDTLVASVSEALRHEFRTVRLEAAPPALSLADVPPLLRVGVSEDELVREAELRLARYVQSTQPRLLSYLELAPGSAGISRLVLDPKSLRHLEISRPMNPDDPEGTTLLDAWDETVTAPGRRTLAFWLGNPLADVDVIVQRQEAVEALRERGAELLQLRASLDPIADLSRIGSRIAGRRVRPAELWKLRESLHSLDRVQRWIRSGRRTPVLDTVDGRLETPSQLADLLDRALPGQPRATEESAPLFRPEYAPSLDRLREEERIALTELSALERSEQESSGIRSLRVGFNQIFGYYFEVSNPNLSKVPTYFRRKQTLSGGERFTTDRLAALEQRILATREAIQTDEASLWESFLSEIDRQVPALHRLSRAVGELDALASFAQVAQERNLVRPTVDDSTALVIRDGRHPVLDWSLHGRFVPNDTELDVDGTRLLVLTGPNMSGKSTYMRQVGLLVVLAQSGSYLPAKFARVGVVDRLFTRMGFTDEIGRGKSSFMVEMTEVAEILQAATSRSLVLLDEVGRGTSTFDGLALAWATLRDLHDRRRSRTILATHYHQLTELVEALSGARNGHLASQDQNGEIVFLHRLIPGSTDRSYGIHVARLAGVPSGVLQEAERLLRRLEHEGIALSSKDRPASRRPARYTQAMLLAAENLGPSSTLAQELQAVDLDRMTPIEAWQWMRERRDQLAPKPAEPPP